jgi:hypothetical protein
LAGGLVMCRLTQPLAASIGAGLLDLLFPDVDDPSRHEAVSTLG